MNDVILVAVNDSPAGFAATEVAIEFARRLGANLHAVCVVEPEPSALITTPASPGNDGNGKAAEADAMLKHVSNSGAHAGLKVTTHRRSGPIASEILAVANEVSAGLLILALVDRPGHMTPYIGSHTLRVLEFATVPVLVVPVTSSDR